MCVCALGGRIAVLQNTGLKPPNTTKRKFFGSFQFSETNVFTLSLKLAILRTYSLVCDVFYCCPGIWVDKFFVSHLHFSICCTSSFFAMASQAFRETFSHTHKEIFNWFPGHMTKGMRLMQQKLRSIDGIIELHDARIPLSGRNELFKEKLALVRPHILLLNKKDLADLSRQDEIVRRLKTQGISEVLFTDCLHGQDQTVKQTVPLMVEMIKSGQRYVSPSTNASIYTLMIIGVPNVGKSSFINAVRRIFARRGTAAKVGANPGMTRAVQHFITVSEKPKMCVIDTPGIAHPKIRLADDAMKLAVCNIMEDSLVGEEHIVDYLLFWLNKRKDFRYVEPLGLTEPVDSVRVLLIKYAVQHNLFLSTVNVEGGSNLQKPDTLLAAKKILRWFRKGEMGKIMLDDDKLDRPFYAR